MLLAGAGTVHAQIRGRVTTDTVTRRIQFIAPESGPVGTVVTVRSGLMPAITPVRIGFGGGAGFEALEAVLTSERGEFSISARIPEWATNDRSYRFIVLDFYFRPIALSALFHVTDANGVLTREGQVTNENAGCITMRDVHGDLYTLTGEVRDLRAGERVSVQGTLGAAASACRQGTTIRVSRILRRSTAP
jgi:hypothetical protein